MLNPTHVEILGRVFIKHKFIMASNCIESLKFKSGFTFINTHKYVSGVSGLLPLKLRIFKEEGVLLSIAYITGVKVQWLGYNIRK